MDDLQAPVIPGYTIGRLLGRGGTATVWLATELRTGRDYALKCVHGGHKGNKHRDNTDRDSRDRDTGGGANMDEGAVEREVRILAALDHQHLVKAHHVVPVQAGSGAVIALAMDYAAGGSLARLVAVRGRLSVGETVTVLTPVAQALGYLHSHGVTHLDVSPGNVLFSGQGKPLLSDVGIARMLGEPGRVEKTGTPGFVDPAPVDAVRAGLQPERDVYSAAALGWYCLTGEPPARTVDRPPLSLLVPEVPEDLAAVLEAGLNEDRRLRPTAAALATAVFRSAPPRPLDLAAAVHPTVIPELVTRRHVAPPSGRARFRGSGPKEIVGALRRRLLPARLPGGPRTKGPSAVPGLPFPLAAPASSGRGRHAGAAASPSSRRGRRRTGLPGTVGLAVAAVLVITASWWLAGTVPSSPAVTPGAGAAAAAGGPAAAKDLAAEERAAVGTARSRAAAADPAYALAGLAALRDQAFRTGDLALLEEVNADGSAAAAADRRTGEKLRESGLVLSGFSSTLAGVATEPGATPARAVVRATSATSSYEQRDSRGSVLGAGTAGPARPLRLVLVRVDGTWRISDILPGS